YRRHNHAFLVLVESLWCNTAWDKTANVSRMHEAPGEAEYAALPKKWFEQHEVGEVGAHSSGKPGVVGKHDVARLIFVETRHCVCHVEAKHIRHPNIARVSEYLPFRRE